MRLFHLTKRTFAGVVSCLIAGVLLLSESALCTNAYTFTPDITLHSAAAILYNQDTEQILYEKNADQQQAQQKEQHRRKRAIIDDRPYIFKEPIGHLKRLLIVFCHVHVLTNKGVIR